ncbi:MAG TPA: GNAT family N-acetyltransferase [Gaiellales bacterium]|jgi:GNAT acetyltransferase|nr:GNAT family N-acetyltransferase [Gaiellales bacterium]
MWLGDTVAGAVIRLRQDVDEDAAVLLRADRIERELTFVVDHPTAPVPGVPIVMSGTPDAAELVARLESDGLPAGLAGMGFAGTGDLWEPWCAALDGDEIVSVAFAARLSPLGAEAGVATVPGNRGRGLAAAVTAAWSQHPQLAARACFYTTAEDNRSSRRVAERLSLRLLGATISVP